MSSRPLPIIAAVALALSPFAASAQPAVTIIQNPSLDLNGVMTQSPPPPGDPSLGPERPIDVDQIGNNWEHCGAEAYRQYLGQPVSVMQEAGIAARYFTPDMRVGTTDYLPHRLNVSTDNNYYITGFNCG